MARYAALIVAAAAASSASSNHMGVVATQATAVWHETPSPQARHLACATPARSAPAPRRFWPIPSARRGTAPQKSRKRFKHLAARVVCGVGAHAARSLKHIRACTRLPETRQQESRAIPSVATSGRMVSTSDMPNAESALKPGWIFLADGPAGTLGRCWKPLARPRSAGGAPATWPAAWSEAPPAAMAAREMATNIKYSVYLRVTVYRYWLL